MKLSIWTVSIICFVFSLLPAVVLSDNIIELPESGTDVSSLRCDGSIISTGDALKTIEEKCGAPLARGHLPNRMAYDVWVYRLGDGAFVKYLGFINRRLERIYSVSCVKKGPYCQ